MKITHAISDTNIGGAGILLCSVIGALKDDFEFEVLLPEGSRLAARLPKGVKITEMKTSPDKSFCASDIISFISHFRKNKADILHTHASLSARIAGRAAGIPVCISTRHCALANEKIKKRFLPSLVYNVFTDLTVSTADFATQNLVREGVRKSKIVTVKNGSASLLELAEKSEESTHDRLGIPKNKKIIGCVARIERIKGQDVILRAARELLRERDDVHFLFIGDGSMLEEYKKTAASFGIRKSVTFLGYTNTPHIYQKDFYINVNASRGTETSCLATSEAMSLGIPTLASSFGGNTEMITDFESGFIFRQDDHLALKNMIVKLLDDKELHERLSVGARRAFCERFSLQRMADDYRKIYRSIYEAKLKKGSTAAEFKL